MFGGRTAVVRGWLGEVLETIFGREHELAALARFVDKLAGGLGALVLLGRAGAGKTTLFDSAVRRARDQHGFKIGGKKLVAGPGRRPA